MLGVMRTVGGARLMETDRYRESAAHTDTKACSRGTGELAASVMTGTVPGDGVGRSAQQRTLRQVTVPAGGASEGWLGAGGQSRLLRRPEWLAVGAGCQGRR